MSSHDHESSSLRGDLFDVPPGLRLRQAREAMGLSTAQVAERLKLRTALVEAIEREDLAALGAPVFARGYIGSYAGLVGLPCDLVDQLLPREQAAVAAPPLRTSHTGIPHGRYMLDRYARRFVYVALTASIVVPVVLLTTGDRLTDPATLLAPLDVPLSDAAPASDVNVARESRRAEEMGPPAPGEHAVMASLTPFYSQPRAAAPAPSVEPAPVSVAAKGLVLEFTGDSWVEVIGNDGTRLTHELLRAGTQREFDQSRVSRVLLGNAAAVTVRLNGSEVDIEPFRRANVARFTVSSDGSLAPAGG